MTERLGLSAVKLLGLALLLQASAGQRESPLAGAGNAADWRTLRDRTMVAMQADCLRPPSPADRSEEATTRRNRLLRDLALAIDLGQTEYELELMRARGARNGRGGSELRAITSETAAWARAERSVGGEGSRPRTRAERESLRGEIFSIFWTQMRANRAAAFALIRERLAWPYESWNTCLAMAAAIAYEYAGRIEGAVRPVAALTEAAARAAEAAEAAGVQPER